MTDLTNVWPSWGENGELPPIGFFYEKGDRVNEKHLDALWNNLNVEWAEIISGITNRTKEIEGDTVLDTGLAATAGTGTNVNVSASTAGAYVDGQRTGSVSSDTVSLSSNGTGSTRTDTIQLSKDGIISANEGSTSPSGTQMKLAEVDVTTSDTISAVRQHTNRNLELYAQDEQPANPQSGAAIWRDTDGDITKTWDGSAWESVATRSWVTTNYYDKTTSDSRFLNASGDTLSGNLDFSGNNINNVNQFNLQDRDGDGVVWRLQENSSNGHLMLVANGGGGTQLDLEHNGNLRIEGSLTEGAAL